MPLAARTVRITAALAAAAVLAIALGIRAITELGGPVEQVTGTSMYATVLYLVVVIVRPTVRPLVAGAIVLGWCWFAEFAQLTGIPAALSERSYIARMTLGARFDPVDLFWYPMGTVPLVVAHWLIVRRTRRG